MKTHTLLATPQNGSAKANHSAFAACIKPLAVMLFCVTVTGCAIGKSSGDLVSDSGLVTGSVASDVELDGIDTTDAEAIKLAVAVAEAQPTQSHLMGWDNPETGNSGTITAINDFVGSEGQSCRKFSTTVDGYAGSSLYEGETCETSQGSWVLSGLTRNKSD